MDQLIPFHKSNKNSEEWEDDGLAHSLNQTPYCFFGTSIYFAERLVQYEKREWCNMHGST
jgi:hypothetical protein